MIEFPKRGDIWLVALDPALGAEIRKTRPALIISNNINNQYSQTITILPITDKGQKIYPVESVLSEQTSGLSKVSKIKCQQIRTIDKQRLVKKMGAIEDQEWKDIQKALLIHLGINE